MMRIEWAEDILDGCAFLEYDGKLYEYVGSENGECIFEEIRDGSKIKCTYTDLISKPKYKIRY